MTESAAAGGGAVGDAGAPRQLVRLVFARLSLTLLSFGIAIALDGLGRELPGTTRQGVYWTVAAAFATTLVAAALLARGRVPRAFVAVQLATDVAIVTSLVHYSGGRESIFTFLYVVVTLYGAVLFERRGALIAASLSAAAYGALLLSTRAGWLRGVGAETEPLPLAALLAIWAVHVGALYLVGVLASLLSSELSRTGRALVQSTSDLRRLRDLHQRTVESLLSGLLTLDARGQVTSFNPEAERITGVSAAAVLGRPLDSVIPGGLELVVACERPNERPAVPRTRMRYRNERGDELYLGVAASILRGADGEPQGHVVIFQDVTEVVAMERELRSSERLAAVGEMAAKIAHEIRNPLAAISGSIQILRSAGGAGAGLDAESARLMDIAVRETDRLNGLITDFLLYSRPAPPQLERVAVRALLEEIAELLGGVRGEAVEVRVGGEPGAAVEADPAQLKQVVWNLAANALEAMPAGGRLELAAERAVAEPAQGALPARRKGPEGGAAGARRWVEIRVSDTGEGIPPEVLERIFEPFFTTKRTGTGLGLATVHRIVESHGGAIGIESEVGAGTCFRVWLPAAREDG